MIMSIQNLVSLGQFVLKILSKNQILTCIKGRNYVANLRKITIYDTDLDLLNDNVYTKFGLNLSICSQDIEQKPNSDSIKGRISVTMIYYTDIDLVNDNVHTKFGLNRSGLVVVSGRNLNSSKLSCMFSLSARIRMIKTKMKEQECIQDFSHYKSMGNFPDSQWQLTLQSMVGSGQISNSSKTFWLFL